MISLSTKIGGFGTSRHFEQSKKMTKRQSESPQGDEGVPGDSLLSSWTTGMRSDFFPRSK